MICRRLFTVLLVVWTCGVTAPVAEAQGRPRIGTNLARIDDWQTDRPFLEFFKTSRPWFSGTATTWGDNRALDLDGSGWVRSLQPGQVARALFFWDLSQVPGQYQRGNYIVRWDGEGTITYQGSARIVENTPGRQVIDVDPSRGGGFALVLTSTTPANYVRNITVRFATAPQDGMFDPVFLERNRQYDTIRFKDWGATDGGWSRSTPNTQRIWADRTRPDHAQWSNTRGVPIEIMVALANRMHVNAWFSIPHQADDDYIRRYAQLVRDSLNPDLKVYVEYSNEVWNGVFAQAWYAQERGLALGLHTSPFEAQMRFHALRSREVFGIWEEVFGNSGRLVRVLGGWSVNVYMTEQMLAFRDVAAHTDVVAIAPYFGVRPDDQQRVRDAGLDGLFDYLRNTGIPFIIDYARRQVAAAGRYGIEVVSYEAGQHLVATAAMENDATLNAMYTAANRDPRMGQLYDLYLRGWVDAGGDLMAHFISCARSDNFGRFGALEYLEQPRADAPKYDALMRWIEAQRAEGTLIWHNARTGALEWWRMQAAVLADGGPLEPSHVPDLSWNLAATADFNRDGHRDLLWQHLESGFLVVWLMNSHTRIDTQYLTPSRVPDVNWQVAAAGDLNGDGHTDLVWQHHTEGHLRAWLMSGLTRTSDAPLDPPRVANTNWKVVGTMDANSDGRADLIWHHLTDGWVFVSFMNGTAQINSEYLVPNRVPDTSWRLAGVVDSDADGRRDDLVWQHRDNGFLFVWRMEGRERVQQMAMNPDARSAGWRLAGTRYPAPRTYGDIDGDGHADLLLRDRASGQVDAWLMNGATRRATLAVGGETNPWWQIVALADFNGDAHPDVLWQHIDGWMAVWLMRNGRLMESVAVTPDQEPDSNWRIAAAYDINGDARTDVLWQHRTLGTMRVWFMDGLTRTSEGALSHDRSNDPGWRVVGTGDVNQDGRLDLVWWHSAEGWLQAWYMNGASRIEQIEFTPNRVSDMEWRVVGVADINRDGGPDMIWQHRTHGWLHAWYFWGGRLLDSVWMSPTAAPPGWTVVGAR